MPNQKELEEIVNSVTAARDAAKNETPAAPAQPVQLSAQDTPTVEQVVQETPAVETVQEAPAVEQTVQTAVQDAPAAVQPAAQVDRKQKMAQIREALAMVNDGQEETAPVRPVSHEVLPPLKRKAASAPAAEKKPAAKPAAAVSAAAPAKKKNSTKNAASKNGKKKPMQSAKSGKAAKSQKTPKSSGSLFGALPGKVCAAGIGGAVALSALIGYFVVAATYQGKFLPNTMVDAIDLAGMNDKEAQYRLLEQKTVPELKLTTPKGETVSFSPEDFEMRYSIPEGSFAEAATENPYTWIGKLFVPSEYQVNYDLNYSEWKLRNLINEYDWGDAVSENAQVVRDDSGNFIVRPETLGDQFDTGILLTYIAEQVKAGRTSINMEDSGCYELYRAEITEADLEAELHLYNSYANCTITYDFDDRKKVVDSDLIVDWIMLDEDGAVKKNQDGDIIFDYNGVSDFVAKMASETDTWGKDRQFQSTMDGWITVKWDKYSCYGWQIDQEATIAQLIQLMREGETVTVEPIYTDEGHGYSRKTDDIGNTYIDVDISEQHLWVYKEGTMVFEADFVSGTETIAARRTPRGVCRVRARAMHVTLGTYAVQGYETPVTYWMPFNYYGCGFHDLPRRAYGGQIYMYNGSHGCLNMSLSKAKELYNTVEVNMPVLVHD